MARFIVNLIAWGLLFLSLGTLVEVTSELATKAARAHATGLIKLTRLNGLLTKSP